MNILIVDDSTSVRRMLSSVLVSLDFEVAEADSGEAALALLDTQCPDAIMTDFNMPGMDGLAFIEKARNTANGRHIPILVLSSESCPAKIERAARCGVAAWMTKPLNIPSFAQTIFKAVA